MYIGKICQKVYTRRIEPLQTYLVVVERKYAYYGGVIWSVSGRPLSKSHVRASHPFCPISSVAIQDKELRDWVVKSIACGHQCIKMCRQRDTHVLTSLKLLSAPERCRDGLVCVFIYIYGPFLTYFVVKM